MYQMFGVLLQTFLLTSIFTVGHLSLCMICRLSLLFSVCDYYVSVTVYFYFFCSPFVLLSVFSDE